LAAHEVALRTFVPLIVRMAMATVSDALPRTEAIDLVGEINGDWIPTLRIRRVVDANGNVLFDGDEGHEARGVEDAIDEANIEYLDPLIELTGDTFMGATTIDSSTADLP
jgi:hypothetical protein